MRGCRSPLRPFFHSSMVCMVVNSTSEVPVEIYAKKKGGKSMLLRSETVW